MKNTKMNKLAKLKTRKGGLGKNEHPDGLTTYIGNSGKNRGNEKNLFPSGLKTRKGDPGKNGMMKKQTKTNMQKALTTDAIPKSVLDIRASNNGSTIKRLHSLQVYEGGMAPCPQQWS